jgi:hypothetical protein
MEALFEARQQRLERAVTTHWDSEAEIRSHLRPNGMVELTVVSLRFEGVSGSDREGMFWATFAETSREDLIYMAYCLLLTPDEAQRYFAPAASEDEAT